MLPKFVIQLSRYKLYHNDKKPLPAMTICPMTGFKQEGFFYKQGDVLNNTLDLRDIIIPATYNDTRSMMYQEPIAQQIGRCFSLKDNHGYQVYYGMKLHFNTTNDLKIYIHAKGDELWLTGFQEFPYEVATFTLDITKKQNSLALLSMKEVSSVRQSKPEMPCTDYDTEADYEHELFLSCCKKSLWKHISNNISCTVADMKPIIPTNSNIIECTDRSEAISVYWAYIGLLTKFWPQLSKYDCPFPCRQTSYQVKLKYYHKNNALLLTNISNFSKDFFTLYSFFSTFDVEEKIESFEYDLANLLVSAGGNLSLFLGFSCLSIMFALIGRFQMKCAK